MKPPTICERDDWLDALRHSATVSDKQWRTALALSAFGVFGLDRFYLGYPLLGLVKLATGGAIGIWWVADFLIILSGKMKDGEGKVVKRVA